jgi:hypothetical protein
MPLNTITQNATFNQRWTVANYPASDGWSLRLSLNPRQSGVTPRTVDSTPDGDDHLFEVASSVTANWTPGWYSYQVWAINGTERYAVEHGQVQVLHNLDGAPAGTDTRSDARRVLDELREAYQDYVLTGNFHVASYTINGRSVTYRDASQLLAAISRAEAEVRREELAADMAAGRPNRRRLQVRLGRA